MNVSQKVCVIFCSPVTSDITDVYEIHIGSSASDFVLILYDTLDHTQRVLTTLSNAVGINYIIKGGLIRSNNWQKG